jgi:hypothetical protein
LSASFVVAIGVCSAAEPASDTNTFNRLVRLKAVLEAEQGIQTLECFPFEENLGRIEDQKRLAQQCLAGASTVQSALTAVPGHGIHAVGIGTRFVRANGFSTLLAPWDATQEAIVNFVRSAPGKEDQAAFLEKLQSLRKEVRKNLGPLSVYCSQRISNEDCLRGYGTFAQAVNGVDAKKTKWSEVVITESGHRPEDPSTLALAPELSGKEMTRLFLDTSPQSVWAVAEKMYEDIETKHEKRLKGKLHLVNFFCDTDLSPEECGKGAANLAGAADYPLLQKQHWGKVHITRSNTFAASDFDVHIRFDLSPEEIVGVFAERADKTTVEANSVLAEKLELRTRNNPTGLRVVCDLVNLQTRLCVQSFTGFIDFVKTHRDYAARPPWSALMFVDGSQLSRVNFALNSGVRTTYIYADANGSPGELGDHLRHFMAK